MERFKIKIKYKFIVELLICFFFVHGYMMTVQAAVLENTTSDSAVSIEVNKSYTDSLLDGSDVNWYKITLPQRGFISLEFNHEYVESDSWYWKSSLYDSDMKNLASYGYAGNQTKQQSGKIGVEAGIYYIKVNAYNYSDSQYHIKMNYTTASDWETEFNESYARADVLEANEFKQGTMRTSGDIDWYKITLPQRGFISLEFNHEYVESDSWYWKSSLYDSDMKNLASYGYAGNQTKQQSGKIGVEAGIYYIKVNAYNYSDSQYHIKMNYTTASDWETEFNESYKEANRLDVYKMKYGTMRTGDDTDWYKITLPQRGFISLEFNHEYVESGSWYWKSSLYDSDMKNLASYGYAGNQTKQQSEKIGVEAGIYYIKVNAYNYSDKTYKLKVNFVDEQTAKMFSDVMSDAYYYDSVMWAASNGITTGVGGGSKFDPNGICTRAHVVTFLWRQAGAPEPKGNEKQSFSDVKQDDYFYKAVMWAVENGITTGVGNTGKFKPYDSCTRANIVTFLWRASDEPVSNADVLFTDVGEGDYYYQSVQWAVENGITTGVGDSRKFKPNDSCTRANTVTFMYRAAGEQ